MIFVAPLLGAVLVDSFGGPALFWFAAASAGLSLGLSLGLLLGLSLGLLWATQVRWTRGAVLAGSP